MDTLSLVVVRPKLYIKTGGSPCATNVDKLCKKSQKRLCMFGAEFGHSSFLRFARPFTS